MFGSSRRSRFAWCVFAVLWLLSTVALGQGRGGRGSRRRQRTPPSLSMGYPNGGSLTNGVRLTESESVRYLPGRPHHFGTEELVGLVRRAATAVARGFPGSRLTVGDLSDHDGGPIGHHASHQSGRDVDLSFYVTDARGRPRLADDYLSFDGRGRPIAGGALRFDVARNWALVAALLEDSSVRVEHVFVSNPLRSLLIAHARSAGVREATVARAQLVLHQPVGALPHRNHFHVRIACPQGDPQCVEGIRPRPRPRRRVVATGRGHRREVGRAERGARGQRRAR